MKFVLLNMPTLLLLRRLCFLLLTFYSCSMMGSTPQIKEALLAYEARDYEQAIENLKLQVATNNRDALFYLAMIQNRIGQNKDALKSVDRLLGAYPDYADGHYLAGLINLGMIGEASIFKKGSYGKAALESWEKTVELDPTHLNGHYALFAYRANAPGFVGGDLDLAKAMQQQLTAMHPGYGAMAKGVVLGKEDNIEGAEAAYQEAVVEMERAGPYFVLAQFYMGTEEFEKAAEAAETYLTDPRKKWWDPDITVAHLIIARANLELGNSEIARQHAEQALALRPNERIREMLEKTLKEI